MKYFILSVVAICLMYTAPPAQAADQEIEQLRQQLEQLKLDYNNKLEQLEKRLQAAEQVSQQQTYPAPVAATADASKQTRLTLILA